MKVYVAMFEERVLGLYMTRAAADAAAFRFAGKCHSTKQCVLQFNLKAKTTQISDDLYLVRKDRGFRL
jgi:hypothetical protein